MHGGCIPFHPGHECTYLQVDLLGVGGLSGDGSIDCLLEREGEDGGDPRVARGAHLTWFDGDQGVIEIWNYKKMSWPEGPILQSFMVIIWTDPSLTNLP